MVVGSFRMGGHSHMPPAVVQADLVCGVLQSWPALVPPTQIAQAGSLQSISPLQSLSILSSQWPASGPVGTQAVVLVVLVVVVVVVVVVVHKMWLWSQTPWPLHPAVVQLLLSVSVHGVLLGVGGWSQLPVCGLHGGSCVHSLLSGGHTVTMWFWSQPSMSPSFGEELSVPLQPAFVHALPSVSLQGVLSGWGG